MNSLLDQQVFTATPSCADQRSAFLDRVCQGDTGLRSMVQKLLEDPIVYAESLLRTLGPAVP